MIPEEYSAGELKYLEVYAETIQDMVLTERERNLLATLATAYEIDEDRRAAIEKNYRDSQSLGPVEAIKIVGSLRKGVHFPSYVDEGPFKTRLLQR